MMGIILLEVFEHLGQKYVEVVFSKSSHMVMTLNRELALPIRNSDVRFVASRFKWDGGADTHFSREHLANNIVRSKCGKWNDKYKAVSDLLHPIVMNALDKASVATSQQKKRCECPVDVLMNQGCQCGGK